MVGIAADETHRFEKEKRPNRILPLVDWGVTEADALQYCYDRGFYWEEDFKELYNIYKYLPGYWSKLKELQYKTDRPYRRQSGKTLFDLETEFINKKHLELITKK